MTSPTYVEQLSPEKLNDLRRRVLNDEEVSAEEIYAAIVLGVGDRLQNWKEQQSKVKKTRQPKGKKVDLAALLNASPEKS